MPVDWNASGSVWGYSGVQVRACVIILTFVMPMDSNIGCVPVQRCVRATVQQMPCLKVNVATC